MTQHFKIEKGIPEPLLRRRIMFPFGQMETGDSFTVPVNQQPNCVSAASWYGTRHGKKFSVRKQPDGTYRCWRIA